MVQQNIDPSESTEEQQIRGKIMLLFLIDKMDLPMSNGQITQFALSENYLNYYKVQLYLSEMVEIGYLDASHSNNTTRYTITEDGLIALEAFLYYIPTGVRSRIQKYVVDNRKIVKQDFEVVANHFYDFEKKEYTVKCGVYEDDTMMMEMDLSVVSKDQAVTICNNWKRNVDSLYGQILHIMLTKPAPAEPDEDTEVNTDTDAEAEGAQADTQTENGQLDSSAVDAEIPNADNVSEASTEDSDV